MNKKSFDMNIDTILAQDPGDPATEESETMLDLFKRTKTLKDNGGSARAGDLEFYFINGRWLWVRVYIDQDIIR